MSTPRRRPSPPALLSVGAIAFVLVITAAILWAVTSAGPEDTDTGQEDTVTEPRRVMLAGDSMTQGANGDVTWRFHLWSHLTPHVPDLDFVGPYTDPASREMILPVPTEPGDDPSDPSEPDDEAVEAMESAGWPGADGDADTAEYRDPDFDQEHNALWGRTLADAAGTIGEEARVHRPDVLCVMLGVNDLLWPVTMDEMEYRLRSYVSAAREGEPHVRVVLAESLPIALAETDEGFALRQYAYNELVREVAAELSTDASPVVSLDIAGSEDWDVAEDTYDGTHPTPGGEVKIAAAFADALATEFGMGESYPRPLPTPS
ncbi:lysophospholipase L1-like esterase [Nocardiopsis sp. Huas11]|uniref:GDSL-type esterase/lipase family protein n=1 Tax=Nocardiopsis sp. Huas11 TaxID=2183912 RepID=UPI000EB2272E|nr:GDSL-type esterase/lipase family protein [Nocardiopsis sp. Huas11]RKS10740.1 lysophospholipase L1-like esterase [Nocardiopsis sp. Huas11]